MINPPPIYVVGEVDWLTSQALYHGLAELNHEAIVLCWPNYPYVSLGCHEPFEDFCGDSGLPVTRRSVGGSLVYLDPNQVFYQVILRLDRPNGPKSPEGWYRLALDPVVRYLQGLGKDAELRLPADILVEGRKISGNAGGQLGDSIVVVGNLLCDFSVAKMASARNVPHPKMRPIFAQSMARNLTTMREQGMESSVEAVMRGLATSFELAWGAQTVAAPWNTWQDVLHKAGSQVCDPKWLISTRTNGSIGSVKVREGVYLEAVQGPNQGSWIIEKDTVQNVPLRAWRTEPELSEVSLRDLEVFSEI